MTPNTPYEKILSQNGLEEFKSLITKWEALSKNMAEKPFGVPIILPDLFLVSHAGTGRTHFLKLLSEYLSERPNLMDFYGDVKYFEFMLNYCEPDRYFSDLQRLMNEIDNAAGFRSEYRGIIYIDIDEWREHFEEKHFISFMEYLSDNSDDWLIVLSVSDDKPEQVKGMEAFISSYIRIELINIEIPTVEALINYAKKVLEAYGILLDSEAEATLSESMVALCNNKYFDGYKTMRMICQDIAYCAYIKGVNWNNTLSSADISEFSKNSDYIQRLLATNKTVKKIGFC